MNIWSAIGGVFNPDGQAAAQNAGNALNDALIPGSALNRSGQLTGDQSIINAAAALGNTNITPNTSNLDADTAAYGGLGALYSGIATNGGGLTKAVGAQAAADLANTSTANLRGADRTQAANVLAQDQAERNWAASGATQSRAQQLATKLQKQVWSTAVSHANFEAALAAQGLKNQDHNAAFDIANSVATAGQNARNNQTALDRQQQAQDYKNTMAAIQMISAAGGAVGGTIQDMMNATPASVAQTGASTGFTSGAQNYDNGYAVPTSSLGTTFNMGGTSKLAAPAATSADTGKDPIALPNQVVPANIDYRQRPIVFNDDGSYSTLYSTSFKDKDGLETLVPGVIDRGDGLGAQRVSQQEAIEHYLKTGEHLGKFSSIDDNNDPGQILHEALAKEYADKHGDITAMAPSAARSSINPVIAGPAPDIGVTKGFTRQKAAPTQSTYVNPITGNTIDPNMPTEASAWGDWITNGSSLTGAA